ncbi:phosphatase domain-containing protein [Lentzea cavernae]|uniref:Polynucleotide kinase PNKP phosphatase domain-containing protein n=1 Tax=Lentzea cavernae TaxID=2020703 RepID=A0ABQ3MU47_9PSEU|nr:AAA family ATPase [Lentzea cavernae]GHH57471.1 hypothetical protein GCM10017774_77010 [Lentzea cavernae]
MNLTLTATRGLPGSGKTTWAEEQLAQAKPGTLVRCNRDTYRTMLHGRPFHGDRVLEHQVTLAQHSAIERMLRAGVSVIVDDTHLASRYLRAVAGIAWRCGADIQVQDFTHIPLEECIRRDALREGHAQVGEYVLRSLHRRFLSGRALPLPIPEPEQPIVGRRYVPDPSLPAAVMVDIDGTVALHGGVRDPYDTSRYHLDRPNIAVITAVRSMFLTGHEVVFCSGRDETYRDETAAWLAEHVEVPYAALVMRKAGDRRRDDVIKLELFDTHIRDRYRVTCVFDDRDRVCRAWRSIGLTVLQVAEGNF